MVNRPDAKWSRILPFLQMNHGVTGELKNGHNYFTSMSFRIHIALVRRRTDVRISHGYIFTPKTIDI